MQVAVCSRPSRRPQCSPIGQSQSPRHIPISRLSRIFLPSTRRRPAISESCASLHWSLAYSVSQPVPAPKQSPILPPLATLLATPLSQPDLIPLSLRELVLHILTIPLLPNRLLPALGLFSARLPLAKLDVIPLDIINDSALSSIESKIHLIANLAAFMPPRYGALPPSALAQYFQLAALLMNALPTHALEPPETKSDVGNNWGDDDSDDEHETQVEVVSSFELKAQLPQLDDRTRKRLQTFTDTKHISAVLQACGNQNLLPAIISFFFALNTIWPARRDKVLGTMVVYSRGGLVRELYRGHVRGSPLGRDDNYVEITSTCPRNSHHHRYSLRTLYICRSRTCSALAAFATPRGLVHAGAADYG